MSEQPDLFGARDAKREALERVSINAGPWFGQALAAVAALDDDWRGTGEDLRLLLTDQVGHPHTPHVWGALTMQAIKAGYLRNTGMRAHMRTIKSHHRDTAIYRRGR